MLKKAFNTSRSNSARTLKGKRVRSRRQIISGRRLMPRHYKGKRPLLIHHTHTGRRISVEHSSFALLAFILVILGALLVSVTYGARADDITVTAKVSAEFPTIPATILSPSDNAHFTSSPITVSGTCQADQFVKIYRNGDFAGSVLCQSDGSFSLDVGLVSGSNLLQARIFNITDDEGPTSLPITVYYTPPAPVAPATPGTPSGGSSGGSNSGSGNASSPPTQLGIGVDASTKVYALNQDFQWLVRLSGGTPPYIILIEWGDGKRSEYKLSEAGLIQVGYTYDTVGDHKGVFAVKIYVSDIKGQTSFVQIGVLIRGDSGAAPVKSTNENDVPKSMISQRLRVAWYGYAFLITALLSFWLGSLYIRKIIVVTRSSYFKPLRR